MKLHFIIIGNLALSSRDKENHTFIRTSCSIAKLQDLT